MLLGPFQFSPRKLRTKLMLAVAGVHAVLMIVFVWDITWRQADLLRRLQASQAEALAQSLATSSAGWLAAYDFSGLQEIAEAQLQYPELRYAMFLDPEGRVLAHTDRDRRGQFVRDLPAAAKLAVLNSGKRLVDVVAPAHIEGRFVGWVRVGLGQQSANAQLASYARAGVLYSLIAILIGVGLAWLMANRLTAKLYAIQRVASGVRAGECAERVPPLGDDEVGRLGREFNHMLDDLSEQEKERRRAEEALRESESLLLESQRIAGLGVSSFNVATGSFKTSQLMDDLFGIDSSYPHTIEGWAALIHPDDRERIINFFRIETLGRGKLLDEEYRIIRHSDKALRWQHSVVKPELDANGQTIFCRATSQDITDRKLAEANLKMMQFSVDRAGEAIFWVNPEGRIIYANEAAGVNLGYTRDELLALKIHDIKPDFPDGAWAEIFASIKQSGARTFETHHRAKNGATFPVEVSASYVSIDGREFSFAFVRNVTERKQAEQALRDNAALLQALTNHARVGMVLVDSSHRYVFANAAYTSVVGYHGHNVVGRHLSEVIGANYEKMVRHQLDLAFSGQRVAYELTIPSPSNEQLERHLAVTIDTPIETKHGRCVVVVLVDITDRKRAMMESNKLAAIVESSGDAIIGKDLNGIITSWNKGAETIFGYAPEEMIGTSVMRLIPPSRSDEEEVILSRVRRGESIEHFETERRTKDGRQIAVAITASPIRDAEGRVIGASKVARDISAKKEAEAAQKSLERQLRQSQKMEAIGTLAGGIAHDFNNILAGIYGFTSLARTASGGNKEVEGYLDEIGRAGRRAAGLIRQILAFSRARGADGVAGPVSVARVVSETVALLRATCPATIEIVTQVASDVPTVEGDETGLHQVVMNLCTNAIQAMRDRVGSLTIQLEACFVDEALAVSLPGLAVGPSVRLAIADTGTGIRPEHIDRVFEPFFTTKSPGEGTGLGLSVVHGIVRDHRGAIRLSSQVGKGTTFEIYLPAGSAATVSKPRAQSKPNLLGKGEVILLVEDEEQVSRVAQLALNRLGYVTVCETNGPAALARLGVNPGAFDLVITDQSMPGMTGLELAARLHVTRRDLPVIITSGNTTVLEEKSLAAAGVREVLAKPYELTDLLSTVRRHLDAKIR